VASKAKCCHAGHAFRASLARRTALQAGSLGLLGLGLSDVFTARAQAAASVVPEKSVILVFLTGGLSHQDSFDLKPDAPDTVRGEFRPIATRTPGVEICEHLPLLAQRSGRFALVRSMSTNSNGHEEACHMLLTGRLDFPPGFTVSRAPSPNEWPSLGAQVTYATRGRKALPPAVVLPQPSVNEAGKVRPGQYAGRLGPDYDAWHLDLAAPCPLGNGACPHCFRFEGIPFEHGSKTVFTSPTLTVPDVGPPRFSRRMDLLHHVEEQRFEMEQLAEVAGYDRQRDKAISVLTDPQVRAAFDVERADPRTLERYGANKFGLSLLMATRLVAAGVNLVQVNLGKNSSWDTHRRNFINLKDNLLPYLDRAVAGLLDDLAERGLLDTTLVVVTGEFGRTPKINRDAGRDHWPKVFSVVLAGGGIKQGLIYGKSDPTASEPEESEVGPADLATTVYYCLGIIADKELMAPGNRPIEIVDGGKVVKGLLA
jgi:hypothetical protein